MSISGEGLLRYVLYEASHEKTYEGVMRVLSNAVELVEAHEFERYREEFGQL